VPQDLSRVEPWSPWPYASSPNCVPAMGVIWQRCWRDWLAYSGAVPACVLRTGPPCAGRGGRSAVRSSCAIVFGMTSSFSSKLTEPVMHEPHHHTLFLPLVHLGLGALHGLHLLVPPPCYPSSPALRFTYMASMHMCASAARPPF